MNWSATGQPMNRNSTRCSDVPAEDRQRDRIRASPQSRARAAAPSLLYGTTVPEQLVRLGNGYTPSSLSTPAMPK